MLLKVTPFIGLLSLTWQGPPHIQQNIFLYFCHMAKQHLPDSLAHDSSYGQWNEGQTMLTISRPILQTPCVIFHFFSVPNCHLDAEDPAEKSEVLGDGGAMHGKETASLSGYTEGCSPTQNTLIRLYLIAKK